MVRKYMLNNKVIRKKLLLKIEKLLLPYFLQNMQDIQNNVHCVYRNLQTKKFSYFVFINIIFNAQKLIFVNQLKNSFVILKLGMKFSKLSVLYVKLKSWKDLEMLINIKIFHSKVFRKLHTKNYSKIFHKFQRTIKKIQIIEILKLILS